MKIEKHKLIDARQLVSPNIDDRPTENISLIVVHNISLPPGQFGTSYVEKLFMNELNFENNESFGELEGLQVSSHVLVQRDGMLVQFVPFDRRAWHAGESSYKNRNACNDFSIGIELEGTDDSGFTDIQYQKLAEICRALIARYKISEDDIVGHSDISPGRKTDPGESFHWPRFRHLLGAV